MSLLFSSIVKGCFAGVLTLIFAPPLARAQLFTLSSITGWWDYDSSAIREVDPATGATISFQWIIPRLVTYGAYTTGLAVHPTTREFFALVESAPSPTGPICQHLLAKIDPATGAATIIGNTGDCFASLAFHSNGTLYGVTNSEGSVPPSLFTLDTTSATPTFLISFGTVGVSSGAVVGGSGLAFNPSDGLLYRSGRVDDSDQIFQAIDPDTLAVTDIPLSGSPTDEIIALTHSFENTLLGADVGNRLFSITTEGVRTLIGPMDHLPRGLAFATTLAPPPPPHQAVVCPSNSLQAAVDAALPGDTISVSGTCNENILVRNDKVRVFLDGGGTAVIHGSDPARPALDVRGKAVSIQNFTITGGSSGIEVNRGSDAVIDNNIIQNSKGHGVLVDQLAFSVITNNTIQNNPGAGVVVAESSSARIGFNNDTEMVASANAIQNNAVGVLVSNNSSARIVGNTISGNTGDGVQVLRNSQADLAANTIDNNGGDGIEIAEDSFIQLGEDSGAGIFESANTTTGDNAGVGVRCTTGGAADGRLGSLKGTNGTIDFDGSCIDALSP